MSKIHPTAIIEENVSIGEGMSVWDDFGLLNPCCIIHLIDAQSHY